jgi:ADP-L-glycero-D-manno-heptose 6-epimerase
MKILLTGHRGFIGQHLLHALKQRGHSVETYEWADGAVPGVMDKDWVIHIGAISSTTERDVNKILDQNYDFSQRLFDECKTFGVNMQYSSSASVYGLGTNFEETAPVDPRTPYAWSKYLFERYHSRHQGGNIVQGFRYFNVYGPEGEEHKGDQASPFAKFKKQAESTGQIKVFEGSEKYRRDFVHVSQIIDMHLQFLDVDESGIWNFGTGTTMSFLDVAQSFNCEVVQIPMPEVVKDSYQCYTCANMTKTKKSLGNLTNFGKPKVDKV